MKCIINGSESYQLHCISPENTGEISALSVYFNPDDGKERLIASCWLEDKIFQCTSNEGAFRSSLSDIHDVQITLPKQLESENGTFRCQVPGMSASNENPCRWPLPHMTIAKETSSELLSSNSTLTNSSGYGNVSSAEQASRSSGNNAPTIIMKDTKTNLSHADIIGIVFGIAALIIILALVFVFLVLRKRRCKKNKQTEVPEEVPLMSEDSVTIPVNLSCKQHHLVNLEHKRVILVGLPGTGKTTVLLGKCTQWLKSGNKVHIVSTGWWSRVASCRFLHVMQHIVRTQLKDNESPGELQHKYYYLNDEDGLWKAVNELSLEGKKRPLYLIADEAGPDKGSMLKKFCMKLLEKIPELHLWASSYDIEVPPDGWEIESLNTPFRFPPAIAREVEKQTLINGQKYSFPDEPLTTEDQSVTRLYHRDQDHSATAIEDCAICGREIGNLLKNLHCPSSTTNASTEVISNSNGDQYSCIRWRDMLLLNSNRLDENSKMVGELRQADIPVKLLLRDKDFEDIKDLATASSDVVWMVNGDRVRGLEKKVVVCLGDDHQNARLYHMSRCTSRLVIVTNDKETLEVAEASYNV